MQTIKMQADGNCLLRAIAHQINELLGLTFDHEAIRRDVVRYIKDHRDDDIFKLATIHNTPEEYNKYIAQLSKHGVWGGEASIIAACEFYLVNITVHQNATTPITYRPRNPKDAVGSINIHFSNRQYDSLVNNKTPSDSVITLSNESTKDSPRVPLSRHNTTPYLTSPDLIPADNNHPMPGNKSRTVLHNCESPRVITPNIRDCSNTVKLSNIDKERAERDTHINDLQNTI